MNMVENQRKLTFEDNLGRLPIAFEHGISVDSNQAVLAFESLQNKSCIAVGSGASFSASVYLSKFLEEFFHIPSKAQTPYEYYSGVNSSDGVVLVSAAGKNEDILAALDRALVNQVKSLIIVTSKRESKLINNAKGYPNLHTIVTDSIKLEEKEGFFGVQSLIAALGAFISLVPEIREQIRVLARDWCMEICNAAQNYIRDNEYVIDKIAGANHVVGLATGWALPSLVDLESKFVEGGLGWIEVAEGKNFTHGRFVNSLRRKHETAIVILATKDNCGFLDSFQEVYGSVFPVLYVLSKNNGALGGVELFIYVFYLLKALADIRKIDISHPEVPTEAKRMFRGSNLYTNLAIRERLQNQIDLILEVKRTLLRDRNFDEDEIEQKVPRPVVVASFADLFSTKFGGFVCDYDGTLVPLDSRDEMLTEELVFELERLLYAGIHIGVITGRGSSVIENLQSSINPSLYPLVYCYLNNGGVLRRLDKDEPLEIHRLDNISEIERKINAASELASYIKRIKIAKYRSQITIDLIHPEQASYVLSIINNSIAALPEKVQIRTSGHSVDIFPMSVSKGIACNDFKTRIGRSSKSSQVMIIGDRGEEDGNDFELLQHRFSLSVDRFHWVPYTCFPVVNSEGARMYGPEATISLLQRLVVKKDNFTLKEWK